MRKSESMTGITGEHDPETGALTREIIQPNHSAARWKEYLRSSEFETHPFARPSGIMQFVGGLGAGKSTCMLNVCGELDAIMKPQAMGRVLWYSGSGGDALLDEIAKNPKIEIHTPKSRESFLTAIRQMLTSSDESRGSHLLPRMNVVVIDDASADKDLLAASIKHNSPVNEMMVSARHIPAVIMLSAQRSQGIPPFARANASHSFVFRTRSGAELEEVSRNVPFSKHAFQSAMASLEKPSEFLWVQHHAGRILKGLNHPVVH